MKNKKRGRPLDGQTPKVNRLFSLDEGIYLTFRDICLKNGYSMSKIIEEYLHKFNRNNI